MKKSQFSEPQIAFILRQVEEGVTVEEVCRQEGISQAMFYGWEMKRLKQLDGENQRLKKLVADLCMDKEMLQGVIRRKL